MTYTEEEVRTLRMKMREYRRTGHPDWALRLQVQMDNEVPFADLNIPGTEFRKAAFWPETQVASHLVDLPPRNGAGASTNAWRQFASLVSDVDRNVLDSLGRDEIIQLMIDRNIIPAEEEDEDALAG